MVKQGGTACVVFIALVLGFCSIAKTGQVLFILGGGECEIHL